MSLGHKTEMSMKTGPSAEEQALPGQAAVFLVCLRFLLLGLWDFHLFLFSLHFLLPHPCALSWPDIKNWRKMKKLPAKMVSSLFTIPSACQLSCWVITSVFLYADMLGAVQIQTKKRKKERKKYWTNKLFVHAVLLMLDSHWFVPGD